ncbi:helix-turn-helix domain-containing protein [Anthocerotibacter panamensis]|uniref:helix-turn-helix domain-containing protein n=1 Tax=Anthocerotibacter panamensis TaxID=2857077 RepID=UPI001C402913
MSCTQLRVNERHQLHALRNSKGLSLRAITLLMARSHTTLSRELHRNAQDIGTYLPDTVHFNMKGGRLLKLPSSRYRQQF